MLGFAGIYSNIVGSDYTFRITTGESMLPTIRTGDYVLLRRGAEDVKVGDIISFRLHATGIAILHRVIKIEENQGLIFRTKGDNNNFTDDVEIRTKNIVGKAILIIPTSSFMTPFVFLPTLCLSLLLLSKKILDCHGQKLALTTSYKYLMRDMTVLLLLLNIIISLDGLFSFMLLANI